MHDFKCASFSHFLWFSLHLDACGSSLPFSLQEFGYAKIIFLEMTAASELLRRISQCCIISQV